MDLRKFGVLWLRAASTGSTGPPCGSDGPPKPRIPIPGRTLFGSMPNLYTAFTPKSVSHNRRYVNHRHGDGLNLLMRGNGNGYGLTNGFPLPFTGD